MMTLNTVDDTQWKLIEFKLLEGVLSGDKQLRGCFKWGLTGVLCKKAQEGSLQEGFHEY